jgi:hypothetical protein
MQGLSYSHVIANHPQDGVAIRSPLENLTIGERIATSLTLLAMTAVELAWRVGRCGHRPLRTLKFANFHHAKTFPSGEGGAAKP